MIDCFSDKIRFLGKRFQPKGSFFEKRDPSVFLGFLCEKCCHCEQNEANFKGIQEIKHPPLFLKKRNHLLIGTRNITFGELLKFPERLAVFHRFQMKNTINR